MVEPVLNRQSLTSRKPNNTMIFFFIFALLFSSVRARGSRFWCGFSGKSLRTYSSGVHTYNSFTPAKNQCYVRDDCFGIMREKSETGYYGYSYSLMKDWKLRNSNSPSLGHAAYVACDGYFSTTCSSFGLKSASTGMFLSVDPTDGTLKCNSGRYGQNEQFHFKQWGIDSGFLYRHDNKYLKVGKKFYMWWQEPEKDPWVYEGEGTNGFMTLYQDLDRIAIQNIHGKYLSGKSDGSVVAFKGQRTETEWFEVYPQSCLNNIQCECPEKINGDIYVLANITFDQDTGTVKSYKPERVGYQYIDNADSSSQQSTTFTVAEEVTETSSFTHTGGVSVAVGTEFKCGVPVLAENKISVEVTVNYEFSYATEKSVTKMVQADYNCVAAPGSIVRCEALLYKYKMRVPFTQTWQHKRVPSCTCQSKGVYEEVSAHEMRLYVDED